VARVKESVNPEVATLAACDDVIRVGADWVTSAKVDDGEADAPVKPNGYLVVLLDAAARVGVGGVHAALALALAAA
jgi:hypothetical protein